MKKLEASGAIFLSIDSGRMLLQQRGANSSHPRTWGFFGGKRERNERPVQTLRREISEEIGMNLESEKIIPLNKFTSQDNKFVYHTFVILVQDEFIPVLNNESSGYAWVQIGNWPRPLHPGVKGQLFNKHIEKKLRTIYKNTQL